MMIKLKFSLKKLNRILFCLIYIFKVFTDVLLVGNGQGGILVAMKYILMLLSIALSLLILVRENAGGIPKLFAKECWYILQVIILFGLMSLILAIIRGRLTNQTIVDLGYILLGIVYSYCIVNTIEINEFNRCMKIILIASIIAYVIEIGTENFNYANLMDISFNDSHSAFESSFSASMSMILCFYFSYFRKERIWTILAFVFCLATFKRLNVLFAVFFLIYPIFFNKDGHIDKRIIFAFKIIFIIGTIFFFWIYQYKNASIFEDVFKTTATKFSTGRNIYLNRLLTGGYKSYGYGSSTDFLGYSLEMDFIKIYVELGFVALAFFISRYYDFTGTNIFCFWFMTENMLNFLTSHSLASAFNWALRFAIIGYINYRNSEYLIKESDDEHEDIR